METCTAKDCSEPGYHTTWIENLTYYTVSLCLCRMHQEEFVKLLLPFMRDDERNDVLEEANES